MSQYLDNFIIGCQLLANTPMGLLRKQVQHIFNCSDHSTNDPDSIKSNLCSHIIYHRLTSDVIIESKDLLLDTINKADKRHTILFYSESITKTRIIICKILMLILNLKLPEIQLLFETRHELAIKTRDLDSSHYQPLDVDELSVKLLDPQPSIEPVIVEPTSNEPLTSVPLINIDVCPDDVDTSRYRDYFYIMSILGGVVHPDIVKDMLSTGLSTYDIIGNLT